jgi:hypothetical protein
VLVVLDIMSSLLICLVGPAAAEEVGVLEAPVEGAVVVVVAVEVAVVVAVALEVEVAVGVTVWVVPGPVVVTVEELEQPARKTNNIAIMTSNDHE